MKDSESDLDKSYQYWQSKTAILSRMKRFEKSVAEFRKKWDIPSRGLKSEDRSTWAQNLLRSNPSPLANSQQSLVGFDYLGLIPQGEFLNHLENLCFEFNLDRRWLPTIYMHVVGGEDLEPPTYGPISVRPRFNDSRLPIEERYVTEINLVIRKDTKIGDIKSAWTEIEKYQQYMPGEPPQRRYNIQQSTVDKYLKVRDLEDSGKKHGDIYEKLGFESTEDVSRFKHEVEERFNKPKIGSQRKLTPLWWD